MSGTVILNLVVADLKMRLRRVIFMRSQFSAQPDRAHIGCILKTQSPAIKCLLSNRNCKLTRLFGAFAYRKTITPGFYPGVEAHKLHH